MSKNLNGELESAIPDSCRNYNPNKSKLTGVRSSRLGSLYKCKNWANSNLLNSGSPMYKNLEDGCLFCDNWQTIDGEYKNRAPEEVAMVFYKENSDKFIEYFKKRSPENKKKILEKVFESEFTNDKVIEWLNKEEQCLVREVGIESI
ncbi:hypothetical protein FJZ53_04760 [Candidatus Woesearchaeota archaeon]|nr:hypothetical protein [Candidatus Woesearchaeota archaeon]